MTTQADICLILEGTYPYVTGGVSSWTHDLIQRQPHLTFHVLCILPKDGSTKMQYNLPSNVVGVTNIFLGELPEGKDMPYARASELMRKLEAPLTRITHKAGLESFEEIYRIMRPYNGDLGSKTLLDSRAAWENILRMYQRDYDESSFLDYFWSWRALMGGMMSILTGPLPRARAYHVMCTGYAGLLGARAKLETGRPLVLTEHGIYTNERLIEIASADWLEETASKVMTVDDTRRNLRDFWSDSFSSYSKICYDSADRVITLFEGNQRAQRADGAVANKMMIIPNGVDTETYDKIPLDQHSQPTVALIGRVVPIKDIKSYIRSVSLLREQMPDIKALIIGGYDEDPEYYEECRQMVTYLGLEEVLTFTGQVDIKSYLNTIDVVVLSSISEAMPLVVLEAGSVGVPVVATDVGACRELLYGRSDENPALGEGGTIVPLSNPTAIADACFALLTNYDRYQRCSATMKKRMQKYYDKKIQHDAYYALYAECVAA